MFLCSTTTFLCLLYEQHVAIFTSTNLCCWWNRLRQLIVAALLYSTSATCRQKSTVSGLLAIGEARRREWRKCKTGHDGFCQTDIKQRWLFCRSSQDDEWPGFSLASAFHHTCSQQRDRVQHVVLPLAPLMSTKNNLHVTTLASRWRHKRAAEREDSEQEAVGKSRTERMTMTKAEIRGKRWRDVL